MRHRDIGSASLTRRVAEERGKGKRIPLYQEDGTGSIILRSAYVCLCGRALERELIILCVFICVCMCWRKGGREASGGKCEMKRTNVPLRKCHTGKICRV